jgi:hypothetical protein
MTSVAHVSPSTEPAPLTAPAEQPGFRAGFRATWKIWLGSRLVIALLSIGTANTLGDHTAKTAPGFLASWDRWDVGLFTKVAKYGYLSPRYSDRTEVDFPGYPLVLRAVHYVLPSWIAAGLVISLLCGLATSAALWSLATADRPADKWAGTRAVFAMVLFPYAVFLFAGYSEGIFLAGASCAWLAARQQRWWLASVCACLSTSSRILGIAVVGGLVVQYLVTQRRIRSDAVSFVVPLLPIAGFLLYMRARTGYWDSYSRAMKAGWGRTTDFPWRGFSNTWKQATNGDFSSAYHVFWCAEILAVLVGVLLFLALLYERRWGEATLVGLFTLIMSSSSYWASGVRAILVAFPLYLWLSRHRRSGYVYALLATPFMVGFVVAFTQGSWVD